jgi:hypothetical protein
LKSGGTETAVSPCGTGSESPYPEQFGDLPSATGDRPKKVPGRTEKLGRGFEIKK